MFRCESVVLRTHWVLVAIDQFTRRIVGFGVHRSVVDGVELCRMFNRPTRGQTPPTYVSSDHDPLHRFSLARRDAGHFDVWTAARSSAARITKLAHRAGFQVRGPTV